jgi:hypothetical protein
MPQQGPYSEAYGQPAQAAAGPSYPTTGYPTTATPIGYQPPAQSPPVAAESYAGAPGPPAGDFGAKAPMDNSYDAGQPPSDAGPSGGYRTADSRYGAAAQAAQPEQSAADRYGTSGQSAPMAPAGSSPIEPYQPGSTGYTPGQTGYQPPGVPKYEMPAQPNVVTPTRSNPYFRPGGTTDYTPSAAAQTPAASPDRYATPPIGNGQNPYAQ